MRLTIFTSILLTLLILCLYSIESTAQENLTTKNSGGKITGNVKDAGDNSRIEADVFLFTQSDSVKVKATACDSLGNFSFNELSANTYQIIISSVGYSQHVINNIKIGESEQKTLTQVLLKKQNVTTEEVLVEGDKSVLTFEGDKKVFNVKESTLNKGGTALDVLKKVPLIDVDINDNVTLRGSQNVKILIDDKPNRYVSLKQLSSDAIEKVEIITNPPAKYEAEGVTGIINIVLKKRENIGFTGSTNLGIGSRDKYNAGLDLSLKSKKTTVFGSAYFGIYNYRFSNTSSTQYFTPVVSYLLGTGNGNGKSVYGSGSLGFEYDIGKKSTIGIEGSYNKSTYNNTSLSTNTFQDSMQVNTSSYAKSNFFDGTWQSQSMSIYFNSKLNDKGRELSADFTYSGNKNSNTSKLDNTNYGANGQPDGTFGLNEMDLTNNKGFNFNLQADYTHPINDKSKIEGGIKELYRQSDNNFAADTLDHIGNVYINNPDATNHFKLSDMISAVYVTYSNAIKDFTFKLGTRVEHTYTKGELLSAATTFTKNYINAFPSLSISEKIGMMNQLQFSYSRRITRPMIYRLNPFKNKYDPKFIMVGNPQLNPEFTDSYELSFMYYTKAVTVTPLIFFRQGHDIISAYSYLADSNVSITTYRNASGMKSYGIDFLVSSRALSWLNLNGTFSYYKTKFDADLNSDYAGEEGYSWRANLRSSIILKDIFNIELYYNYNGQRINAQGTGNASGSLDVGLSKTFMKDKATISLRASDLFKTQVWGQVVNATGYRTTWNSEPDSRSFFLNISYRFGNTDEYISKKKKTKQNSNEGNDQQDSNGTGR